MKKITLLLLLFFISLTGYSQFTPIVEGFESTAGPEALPSTDWYLGTGTWAVFDNDVASGITTTKRWGINTLPTNVYQGTNAAYMDREFIGQGNTSEDFLATPLVHVPNNGELHFFARTFASGQQGTIFQIRIAPNTAAQNDPAAYTTIQTYTEAQLSALFNVYEEKTIPLPASVIGQDIYIAFVQVYTQTGPTLNGDRWLLDNVSVVEKCLDPTNLTFSAVTSFGATLNWANPSGATSWEIQINPPTGPPIIVTYSGTLPYVASGLQPNTTYTFSVKAICANSTSTLVGPSANFTTLVAPPICGGNYIDSGGLAGNYANNITAATGTTTINPITPGEAVTVTFTSFNTELNNDVLKIYNGSVSAANLIGTYSGTTLPPVITSSAANGSLVFVFTSNATTTFAGWTSNITCGPPVACPQPIALNSSALLATSVTLGWTATGSATTWQVLAYPCASGTPTASTTGWTSVTSNPFNITGLTSGTCYNLYVRSDCGAGVSEWAGPIQVTTPALPPVCGGNYVDAGGLANNYSNNTTAATGTTTVTPAPGDVVTVTFTSFNTELNNDVLKIYNGAVSAANLIGTFSGTTLPPVITSSAPDGSLTFVFTSNATVTAAGWIANITCAPPVTACTAPVALTTSSLVFNSVSLGWTATGGATAWQVIALPCTDPAPTASTTDWTAAGTNPFTITGLSATTCYNLYVRSDCSATSGGVSPWSLPISISTPCSFYNVPFQEGFNTGSPSEQCWKVINGNTDADAWDMNYATNPYEGDQAAMMYTDGNGTGVNANNDWLISPQIILTANQRLKFHYRVQSAAEPNQFKVMLSTTGTNQADFTQTLVPLTTYSNTTYIEKKVNISAYSGPVYIAWQVPGGLDGWRVYIDNVIVENLPICPEPDTVVASNVTSSTVDLAWTNGNTETAWEVLALPCTDPAPTAASIGVPAGTNPFTLINLLPNTCYNIYVRAVCSPTEKSIWTLPATINTQCLPFNVPFQEGFNSTSTSEACWTVLNVNGDGDSWNMNYATNPYEGNQLAAINTDGNGGANNDWLISPQIVLNGNQRLRYRYRVQSATEPNDFRVMLSLTGTAPASFTTTVVPLATYGNITYVEKIVNLTGITGNANIGFHVPQGGLDGWRLYIDKVIVEDLPTCFPPINLTVSNIEATSALLGWTDTNTPTPATQWEVIFVPLNDPEPLPSDTGEIVSFNPALMTGLLPGTAYTYYVRSVCSSTDKSEWSLGANFTTLIINDNCIGAVFAVVNQSQLCQQTTAGTITGATASTGVPAACIGTADDDVWFSFLASNPYLNIELQNIVGTTTNLNFAVYSGNCGGPLTQVYCSTANDTSGTVNNLTLGQTYFIRVYSNGNTAQTVSFDLCITTPSSCLSGTSACQNLQYQNTTGVNSQGTIGCLTTSPNPTYYTINVSQTGPINLLLTQTDIFGAPADVDYAAWGPFPSQAAACAAIGNPPTLPPGIGVPVTTTTGCSFLPAATENLNIANATAGQVYVILITNYSDDPGLISLSQTNDPTQPGAGTYDCCPDAFFKYNPVTYCKSSGATNPIPTIDTGSLAGTFSLHPASPTGLVFANTATGEVNLAASAPGNYIIRNTVAATTTPTVCPEKERGYTISIVEPLTATIAYSAAAYCKSITTLQPVTITGTTGGSFSVSPNGGLFINTTTGDINPSLSQPGIYTISYGLPSSPCTGTNPSTTVQIYPVPNIPDQAPITKCDTYTLPALPEGNYYSQSQLTGPATTPLDITIPITTTQVIYAYGISSNGCPLEKSFTVTINKVPQPTPVTIVDPTCTVLTGTVTVTPPAAVTLPIPTNLFISEVTDSDAGSLTYVELYNGTGAAINLSGYRLKFYTSATGPVACDLLLSGTIANGATNVIKVSANPNQGGVVPNQTFPGCGGVNTNDNIRLTTSAGVEIDLWGRTDYVNFTPSNQTGYTYRRLATAPHPTLTWNPADWTAIDPEDYTNVGSYTYLTSNYEYALDSNPYQAGTTFNLVSPGNHTVTVHDLITGCYSTPYPITLNVIGQVPTVADFSYPLSPVCQLDTTNPAPIPAPGFTTGGQYTYTVVAPTPVTAVLALNATTGEIDLATSTPGIYDVKYDVPFDPLTCQAQDDYTVSIEILDPAPADVTFGYTSPICQIAQATLSPTFGPNFVSGGTFTGSAGLIIDATTGVIDLTTPAGSYDVYYAVGDSFNAALGICQKATTSLAVPIVITPSVPAVVGFTYTPVSVCKIDPAYATLSPIPDAGFETGGMFSATPPGLVFVNANTGIINVATSVPNTYSIIYTVGDNTSGTNCIKGGTSSPFSVTIIDATTPIVGFHYVTPICAGNNTTNPTPIPDTGFVTGGVFSSTQLTVDPVTGEIDLASVTPGQTYTVKYDLPINITAPNCQAIGVSSATITTSDPVAVNITGECVNNKFTLTANPVNNSFDQTSATVTYDWEDALGTSVGSDQTLVITTPGLYSVTVNSGGCTGSDADTFGSVLCQIQKGISANSSPGKNDFFDLSGMNVKKLTIFNRYGMKVYTKTNYVNEWGGQADNGDELPDGTYFYVIERNSGENITNWIYINRAQ
jgi:gliding motility-associated-like protein